MDVKKPQMESDEEIFNIFEEQRRQYAQEILYRTMKYAMGYLKDYKVLKEHDFKSNPMWLKITVWWDEESVKEEINEMEMKIKQMVEEQLRKMQLFGVVSESISKEENSEEKNKENV